MNHPVSATSTLSSIGSKLGRLGRFIVFLCTSGWLFPHACTEGMDLTRIQADHSSKRSKN